MPTKWEYDGGGLNTGYEEEDGTLRISYQQPMDRIIAENKFRRIHEDNSVRRRSGKLYEIANIPLQIIMYWRNQLGVDIHNPDDFPKILLLIQSPEWREAVMVCQGTFARKKDRQYFTGPRDRATHPLGSNQAVHSGGLLQGAV